ncbi:MAG: hypothetical protein RJA81_106 [Planctomycetota bacterium]|jgi:sigma-B regulation protein RsbU (phosphoserine phosphatase)
MTDQISRVLLVDDSRVLCLSVESLFKNETDIVFRSCLKAGEAMEAALSFEPTVILQDLVMPDVEGMEMIQMFKSDSRTADIPLVLLSATDEPKTKADAFAEGANDYIVKLPDRLELLARVRYHSRAYRAMLERNRAFRQIAEDLEQAADYVRAQLPDQIMDGPIRASYLFVPSSGVGGDLFGYWWLDDDHFAVYLLDTSGHGVGSCLLSVSAGDILRRRILPNVDFHNPAAVLETLSSIFPLDPKTGKYFTIWYGIYCRSKQSLTYAGAGHPPALIIRSESGMVEELPSIGPFIGLEGFSYDNSITELHTGDRLYLFSDGVYEIRDHQTGRMWEFSNLKEILCKALKANRQSPLIHLLELARCSQGSEILEDDFAIVEFEIN